MFTTDLVRSVLDSAPDAMIIIDSAGRIVYANRQVTALFGHEADAILGHPVELLLPERFRHRHVAHRNGYAGNVRLRPMGMGLELFGMRADGSEFPVEISLSPIQEHGNVLVAAAIRDVSERKRAEAALKAAQREAEHANLAKSRFLATASHDLRQPLQTLGLLSGALRRTIKDRDSLEILQQQEEAIDAVSRLINALLDISKLESGVIKPDLTDFSLANVFDALHRDFASVAANKGVALVFEGDAERAHSDPALIDQLLRNLISNAIKYTSKGTVRVTSRTESGHVRIEVSDKGIGIAPDQIKLIFEEFYQIGVSPNSTREGYGLGLSIVQRIARLLGIPVTVKSEPGQGSTFTIDLPVARAAAGESVAPIDDVPAEQAFTGRPRILLVEDETRVRNAMRTLLTLEGFDVIAAATSEEALLQLQDDTRFDLLVTDYHLEGDHTGTEVIAAARAAIGDELPAVLVTGDTSSAIHGIQGDSCLRIVSKPINSRQLLSLIRSLLNG